VTEFIEHKPGEISPTSNSEEFYGALLPRLYQGPNSRVNFSIGNPAFQPSPRLVAHVGQAALDGSNALYRSERGDKSTLDAIVGYFRAKGISQANFDTVMPGYGVTNLYSMVLPILYEKSKSQFPDKKPVFLMTAPSYGLFGEHPEFFGFDIEVVPLRKENKMRLDANEVNHVIETINSGRGNKRVAVFYNINPHNPLGTVLKLEEMQSLTDVFQEHDTWVVDDMVYSGLEHSDTTAFPLASLDDFFDKAVTMVGISKSFCAASIRSAAVCAPKEIITSMRQEVRRSIQSVSILSQAALVPTLSQDSTYLGEREDYLKRNSAGYVDRAILMRALVNGISSVDFVEEKRLLDISDAVESMFGRPRAQKILKDGLPEVEILNEDVEAGFFYLLDFSTIRGGSLDGHVINDSMTLAKLILENSNLLVLPARCMLADDYHPMTVRVSFGFGDKKIAQGIRHLADFLDSLK
jgi:aspartate/methionine/tyrosine aminotransferase